MAADVVIRRPEPPETGVVVAAPGRGRLARELAQINNHIRGHGMHIVPAHYPGLYLTSSTPAALHYRMEPQGHAVHRLWAIVAHQEEPGGGIVAAQLQVTFPSGETTTFPPDVLTGLALQAPRLFLETLSAKSDSLTSLEVWFERKSGTSAVTIETVSCFDLPRATLTLDLQDQGVDLETCRAGQAVFDGPNHSLGGVAEALQRAWPRRTLFEQSFPAIEIDSGSWTDLFSFPVPTTPHKTGRTDTDLVCRWDVRMYAGDGSTAGEARITSGVAANTDTLTIAAGTTSGAWLGPGEITLACEDVDADDGLQGSSVQETIQVAVRRTAGTAPLYVTAAEVWEPDTFPGYLLTEEGGYLLLEDGGRIQLESL